MPGRTGTKGRSTRPKYDEANSFLMGGESVPSASFLTKGTRHEGEVLDVALRQATDVETRKPQFWENGDPIMQMVVTIQTDEYDDEIEDDDGRRRLYVKYKMKEAVAQAVREADCADVGVQVGGWLGVEFVKQDKPANRAKSGIKHYEAWYEPPDESAAAADFLNEGDEGDEDQDGDGDEGDDDSPAEPDPPKRGRGRTAKAEEPSKPARGRGRAASTEDEPAPSRGRGRGSSSRSSGSGRGRAASSGDDEPPF